MTRVSNRYPTVYYCVASGFFLDIVSEHVTDGLDQVMICCKLGIVNALFDLEYFQLTMDLAEHNPIVRRGAPVWELAVEAAAGWGGGGGVVS